MTVAPGLKYTFQEPDFDLKLTRTDIALLFDICFFKTIDTRQLAQRHPHRSKRYILERVRLLSEHKYIGRPWSQETIFEGRSGSNPLIVGPLPRGARLYNKYGGNLKTEKSSGHRIPIPKADAYLDRHNWNRVFRESYTTTATELMLEVAAVDHGIPFSQANHLLAKYAPNDVLEKTNPLKLSVNVPHDRIYYDNRQKITRTTTTPTSTTPDGYMLLGSAFTFHESDEGTETIVPGPKLRNSYAYFHTRSLLLKSQTYAAYFRLKKHRAQFGIKAFRLLFTTTNVDRALLIANQLHPYMCLNGPRVHPGFILVTDRERLSAADNPYDVPAFNLKGREVLVNG